MTGSVSTIKSADIAKLDVRSMDQILKGTMSGVVASYNGRPGSDVKLQIRGANSMSGSTDPMWIVDGMPITWRNMLTYSHEFSSMHGVEVFAGQEISTTTGYNSFNYFPVYDRVHRVGGYPQLADGINMQSFPFGDLG